VPRRPDLAGNKPPSAGVGTNGLLCDDLQSGHGTMVTLPDFSVLGFATLPPGTVLSGLPYLTAMLFEADSLCRLFIVFGLSARADGAELVLTHNVANHRRQKAERGTSGAF
jgi:hypothetical protein